MVAYHSLKFRIAATIFVLEAVMMGVMLWQVLGRLDGAVARQTAAQEQVTLDLLKGQALQALVTEEFTELQPLMESLQKGGHIVRAVLLDERDRVVSASNPADLGRPFAQLTETAGQYWRQQAVGRSGDRLGSVALEFSHAALEEARVSARNHGILIAVVGMLVIALVGVGTGWLLTRRLDRMREAAHRLAGGDFTVRTALGGHDEIAVLSGTFDQMAQRIASDQLRLQRANAELEARVEERTAALERSLQDLERAQAQLVQTEKLAALGALVAGIAHEVNTPLGIGVTATSYLQEQAREFDRLFQSGQVRRSDLATFLETTHKSTEMVLAHMNRSAELIRRFKMVAVDQSSDSRREFELGATVRDIMGTLNHLLRRRPVQMDFDFPTEFAMDGFPGALGQVLTNLLNNALIHAYDEEQAGCIRIAAELRDPDTVELRFSDDGKGIAPQHLGKIFDPFFTTRFGQGGSGLGLHIVHNLVTGVLGGSVRVESTPGKGTTFFMTLPRVAPARATAG
jgi:two-component system, NtrC family, sensor kinase